MSSDINIVVLDADPAFGSSRAGEGSPFLDATPLARLGHLTTHAGTSPDELVERARDADVLLTNKVVLGAAEMDQLPRLRLISVLATGVNVVDLRAASAHGITVCNVPGYSTMSTAQHTIAMLLELTNHVGMHARDVAEGGWETAEAFSYYRAPLRELDGQTLGIVGYGSIGQQVARIARALGMRIFVHTRSPSESADVTFVDKKTLLSEADVISLHCPLTEQTKHFIDESALAQMKPQALLLNASRGPVVDEQALFRALESGQLAGAATDVLSSEPPSPDNPLLRAPRCLVTPHIAWASEAARRRLIEISAQNIEAFLAGRPQHVVASGS